MTIRQTRIAALFSFLAIWSVWTYLIKFSLRISNSWIGLILLLFLFIYFIFKQIHISNKKKASLVFLLISGILLILYSVLYNNIPSLGRAMIGMLAVGFTFLSCFPKKKANRLIALPFLFILTLPMESTLQFIIGYPFRIITSKITQFLLFPYHVTLQGTTLIYNNQLLDVDVPCSGIVGLLTFIIIGNIFALLKELSFKLYIYSIIISIIATLLYNIIRTSFLFMGFVHLNNVSEFLHSSLGIIAFIISIIFYLSIMHYIIKRGELKNI